MTEAKIRKVTCPCPGSEAGKINTDPTAHLANCWIRKRLLSKRYTVKTTVIPSRWNDGYDLGVVWQ